MISKAKREKPKFPLFAKTRNFSRPSFDKAKHIPLKLIYKAKYRISIRALLFGSG